MWTFYFCPNIFACGASPSASHRFVHCQTFRLRRTATQIFAPAVHLLRRAAAQSFRLRRNRAINRRLPDFNRRRPPHPPARREQCCVLRANVPISCENDFTFCLQPSERKIQRFLIRDIQNITEGLIKRRAFGIIESGLLVQTPKQKEC
jgi:hypothetical protein